MPNHDQVYSSQADQYEKLIAREDFNKNILSTIIRTIDLEDMDVIDLGAGTGRLTCMLAPYVKSIHAFDQSKAMLEVTAEKLRKSGLSNWETQVADHRSIPIPDQCADMVMAGWTICYIGSSNVEDWQFNVQTVIQEMKRVLRPGGIIMILETLGTGTETPTPPSFLEKYYRFLENQYGFTMEVIRTDYRFTSIEEAEELTRFFFGDELADKVGKEKLVELPECTGIWWLSVQ